MNDLAPIGTVDTQRIEALRQDLERNPGCHATREKLATYLLDHGAPAEAAQQLDELLQRQGESAALFTLLAYALQDRGEFSAAIDYFTKALQLDPENEEAELGHALISAQGLCEAERHYCVELALDLADAALSAGQILRARRMLQSALRLDPGNPDARYWYALTLLDLGSSEEALPILEDLADEEPEDGRALLALGTAYQSSDASRSVQNFRAGISREFPFMQTLLSAPLKTEFPPDSRQIPVKVAGNEYPGIAPVPGSARRPLWSVVIPVYGRSKYLPECLSSVLRQYPGARDMEIIVLDNGSEPPLDALVGDLAGNAVRYFRRDHVLPLQQNWNSAVSLCRGHWVHLLHDDDVVLSGFYDRLAEGIEAGGERLGVASCGYELIDHENRVLGRSDLRAGFRGIAKDWIEDIGVSNVINPPCPVIRREAYESLGGYRTDFTYTIDWEFYMRLACHYDWWLEPEHLARYRVHPFNVSTEQNLAGVQGQAFVKAIELARAYLPTQRSATISQRARTSSAAWCLERASIPHDAGNHAGTLRVLQDSLLLNPDPDWTARAAQWIAHDSRSEFREAVAAHIDDGLSDLKVALRSGSDLSQALNTPELREAFFSLSLANAQASKLFFSDEATS